MNFSLLFLPYFPPSQRPRSTHSFRCAAQAPRGFHEVFNGVSRLGIGTWAWGNRILYDYTTSDDVALSQAFEAAIMRGINFFDTADSYGTFQLNARAEILLGQFIREAGPAASDVRVASKVASYPWRVTRRSVADAAARSAERLGRPLDLAQVHWSVSNYAPWQERALWDGVADAVERGDAHAMGVSNFGPKQLRRVCEYIERERGMNVAAVQTQFSLLSREPLTNGLLQTANEYGLKVIGYSPLALGILAGRNAENTRGRGRQILFGALLKGARPLQAKIAELANQKGMSLAQVALAWCLKQNVLVLAGVRNEMQALELVAAQDVVLQDDEMQQLEQAADACPRQMVQNSFQTR